MKHHKTKNLLLAPLFVALFGLCARAQAQTTITTNWSATQGPVKPNLIGLNLWAAMDPTIAKNTTYLNSLNTVHPNFVRYHAGEQLGTTGRGWLDNNGNWVQSRVLDSVLSTKDVAQTRMVTITRWPDKWRASGSDKLDPTHKTDYANWCASLVTMLKNNGAGVVYYEPFNEVDGSYSGDMATLGDIYLAARSAMKAADPNCQIGAPVFANPWNYSNWSDFLNKVGTNIDFVSYHHYATGNSNETVPNIYNGVLGGAGLVDRASSIKQDMVNRGITGPLMLTEQNMFYAPDQDVSRRLMKTSRAAVFDALLLKGLAESGDIEAAPSWNDADYTYGKFSDSGSNFGLRPSAYFMKLARENLIGEISSTSTSSDQTVQGFAVTSSTKYTLCLINRTESSQSVNTNFGGWTPSSTSYTQYEISDNGTDGNSVGGYASSNKTWSGAPQSISMPPNSVFLLVFSGNNLGSGPKPFGGSNLNLPGRLQAENYDYGGQNVGYFDTTYGNYGGQYRNDRADIYSTADAGGGYSVGDTANGEWLRYTVNIAAGTYTIKLRASSHWGTGANAITVKLGDQTLVSTGVGQTWNEDGFTDITITGVNVPASIAGNGKDLRVGFAQGDIRLNWIDFTGQPVAGFNLPGRLQAENYDNGVSGGTYYDTTPGNSGGQFRSDDVDIYSTADAGGGYSVGDTNAGEWLRYTVNIAAGTYNIKLRASSYWGTNPNAITLKLGGQTIASAAVSQTWNDDGFTDINITGANISSALAGNGKELRVEFAQGGVRLNWIEFAGQSSGLANGTYTMTYRHSGKVVDVSGQSTSDDALIIQWGANGGNNQKWTLTNQGADVYSIVNVNSGKAIEVPSGAGNGVQCRQRTYTGANNQKWQLIPLTSGYYKLKNVDTGQMLDVSGGSTADGSAVLQWPDNGGTNQQVSFN